MIARVMFHYTAAFFWSSGCARNAKTTLMIIGQLEGGFNSEEEKPKLKKKSTLICQAVLMVVSLHIQSFSKCFFFSLLFQLYQIYLTLAVSRVISCQQH
jgi:hypothetical protein